MLNSFDLTKIELPSNRKFGWFFTFIFMIVSAYCFLKLETIYFSMFFLILGLLTAVVTTFKEELLLPFNKLWMRIGFLLGLIVSPIVLGFIYFGLFTPISLIMRVVRRDELRLRLKNRTSYWIIKDPNHL